MPESVTRQATSADGSVIGFEVVGEGPPLLVVHGIAADRSQWGPVAGLLAARFSVHLLDRRGRGLSTSEHGEYSLDREGEDIVAVVDAIGAPTFVFGHGHGGLCALKGALLGAGFDRMLIDEAPAGMPGPAVMPEVARRMSEALERGSRDDALEVFLRAVVGLTDDQISGMRATPVWQTRLGTIHTVTRELDAANGYERESGRLAELDVPVRFVVGTESPELMRGAADLLHSDVPGSEFVLVEGRLFTTMHSDPGAIVRELEQYFLAR